MIIGNMGCRLYWVAIFWQSPELKLCLSSKGHISPCAVHLIPQQVAETAPCARQGVR